MKSIKSIETVYDSFFSFSLFADDPICKDYLQIIDVGSKIILYQNCTAVEKPLEILSDSNEVHVRD